MERSLIRQISTGILVLMLQIVVFRHLQIFGSEPDVMLLFVIWLMSFQSRTTTLIITAVFALSQDILLDLWGLHLFAKTLSVMAFYNLVPKEEEMRPQIMQIFLLLLGIIFFNNAVMIGLSIFSESLASGSRLVAVLVGNTLFTTMLGTFLYIFRNDKN